MSNRVQPSQNSNLSKTPTNALRRMLSIALVWQAIPYGWMMWDSWDSPSSQTFVVRITVFLLVPIIAGLVHRSLHVGLSCLFLPVFAIGVMFTVFMLIMPTGHW
jgi:hypothetical protein